MRRRFRPDELAVLRVCWQMGWDMATWDRLTSWEQETWLAYDVHRRETVQGLIDALISQDKYTPETFVMLALGQL